MIKRVNLAAGTFAVLPVGPDTQREFLGGLGLAARLMANCPDLDSPPLDPDLPLIVAGGPLNGTGFPGANRTCFFGVSPLTGLMAGSWLGGNFGSGLAHSGTLALVLEGRAPEPSILVVDEQHMRLVPRPDLWGLTVSRARAQLEHEYGTLRAAIIGPAGERLVPMASVQGDEGHAAGRCGPGAIMGAKNLKAIVALGNHKPAIARPEAFKAILHQTRTIIQQSSFLQETHGPIGTNSLVKSVNEFEAFPTGNFRERFFPNADHLYGERIAEEYAYKRKTCPYCSVRCRLHVRFGNEKLPSPEYESVWAFGADNQIDDYPLIAHANQLCNELGLDTISAGNTIAFYREHCETQDDPSNVLELVEQIARREGPGKILSRGTRWAAAHYGVDYGMQVKGLELPAYDPRKMIGMAIGYATANRGGCHCRAWTAGDELGGADFSGRELAEKVVAYQNATCVRDSMIVCTFLDMTVESWYAAALSAITDEEYEEDQLARAGERIFTLERVLNVRRGVDASQDALPRRIMEGMVAPEKYREGMQAFYQLRDWDANGYPSAEKMNALGLEFLC